MVAIWVVPLGLALGAALGTVNGLGIVLLGLPPIVMTLAMNGILQGAALLYSGGTPAGFASPAQRWFMTAHVLGSTPVVWFLVLFVAAALLLLNRTVFGRRIYAVGNSVLVARFSAVGVGGTLIGVYALSGFCQRARRHPALRLLRPGEPRHGRRLPAALDRGGGGRAAR